MTTRAVDAVATPLRFLLDSNVFIALEPYAGELEAKQPLAAEFVRLASEQGHRLFVHPASGDDLRQGKDAARRAQRLAEFAKFPTLAEVPVAKAVRSEFRDPAPGSNDDRDMRLLAALYNNAVAHLVSDDDRLRKRANRLGLNDRVLTLEDAVQLLRQMAPTAITPPPRVEMLEPYALDAEQPIFDSLRADYGEEFDTWLDSKVRPDTNRDCLIIREDDRYAALAIVKRSEPDCEYAFPAPVSKIATFKVDANYVGSKYGELLLKSLLASAHSNGVSSAYVEVLPRHEALVELLANFGFRDSGARTRRGELVLAKLLRPAEDAPELDALQHHVAYGPPAISGTGQVWMVPIRPQWHRQLFPDAPTGPPTDLQLELLSLPEVTAQTHPWGNALRKAYLSNSRVTRLRPGDTLLFYRSQGARSVTAVGVVERTLRSSDPAEIMSFVSGRTVYTPQEIDEMCRRVGGVLAILFRQDRFVDPPWDLAELQNHHVVTAWPQSITQVRGGGTEWVHRQLTE